MNIKFLFDPIDRLIDQAKDYVIEQDIRKKAVKIIEEKEEVITPELEKRKAELVDLLSQIEEYADIRPKLEESLRQLEHYMGLITFIAEKDWAHEMLREEMGKLDDEYHELRERYVNSEVLRIEEELEATDNFFEVADFANQIWADFDLFEESHRDEVVVQMLVNRMNVTNTKNTETRMGKDLRKTLEHIRLNLIKTTAWSDDDIVEYQKERDRKIRRLKPVNIPREHTFNVVLLGGSPDLIPSIYKEYDLPKKCRLHWMDITQHDLEEKLFRQNTHFNMVVVLTLFPENPMLVDIRRRLELQHVHCINAAAINPSRVVKILEDELIGIAFKHQFS